MDMNLDPVALEYLAEQPVAHVGVIDGVEPYVTPLSFVIDESTLLFRTRIGRRIDAIRVNPRVCIEASSYDDTSYEWFSVIAWGNAREADDDEQGRCLELLFDKYRDQYESAASTSRPEIVGGMVKVIAVPLDMLTSATSSGFLQPMLRPGRL